MLAVVMDLGDIGVMCERVVAIPAPPMDPALPLLWARMEEAPDMACFMLTISVESSSERLSRMLLLLCWLPL
jgi:hypothetical protein